MNVIIFVIFCVIMVCTILLVEYTNYKDAQQKKKKNKEYVIYSDSWGRKNVEYVIINNEKIFVGDKVWREEIGNMRVFILQDCGNTIKMILKLEDDALPTSIGKKFLHPLCTDISQDNLPGLYHEIRVPYTDKKLENLVIGRFYKINDVIKPEKDVFSGGEAGDIIIERSDGTKEEIKEGYGIQGGLWAEAPNIETVTERDENNNVIYSYVRERKNKEEKNMRKIKVGDKIKIISTKNEDFSYSSVIGKIYIVEEIRENSCKEKFATLKNSIYMPYLYNCELVDEKEKQFTKSDLKNGDIVELRNGQRYVYIEKYNDRFIYSTDSDEVIVNLKDGEYSRLANYDDDLRYKGRGNCEYDIMKILDMSEFYRKQKWTWEREKTEEMTLEEVCKELGKDIKIVKEH